MKDKAVIALTLVLVGWMLLNMDAMFHKKQAEVVLPSIEVKP